MSFVVPMRLQPHLTSPSPQISLTIFYFSKSIDSFGHNLTARSPTFSSSWSPSSRAILALPLLIALLPQDLAFPCQLEVCFPCRQSAKTTTNHPRPFHPLALHCIRGRLTRLFCPKPIPSRSCSPLHGGGRQSHEKQEEAGQEEGKE